MEAVADRLPQGTVLRCSKCGQTTTLAEHATYVLCKNGHQVTVMEVLIDVSSTQTKG